MKVNLSSLMLFALMSLGLLTEGNARNNYGCHLDQAYARDLPFKAYQGNKMSIEYCNSWCSEAGYAFLGMQQGDSGYCGDSIGKYGQLAYDSCDWDCTGIPAGTGKCGAFWANSIYSTDRRHIGCFLVSSIRDLNNRTADTTSPTTCMNQCASAGFNFAGVQNGNQCWCGNSYSRDNRAADSECAACGSSMYCGSASRNSIYRV